MIRVELVRKIADAWNQAGLDYAVIHGLEGYPDRVGRDLDVLVESDQCDRALSIATRVLGQQGWRVARPPVIWGHRVVATGTGRDSRFAMIEIHTVSSLTWRNTVFAKRPSRIKMAAGFPIDPWLVFLKTAVLPALARDFDKLDRVAAALGPEIEESEARRRLDRVFGPDLSRDFTRSLFSGDRETVRALAPQLRRATIVRGWIHNPFGSARLIAASLLRRLRQPFSPCAPTIALVGPDGAGKSSLIRELCRQDGLVFNDTVVRHWRPGLLPPLGSLVGREPAHETADGLRPPRRTSGRFQGPRVAYYALDTLLGSYLKDRVDTSRQKLVVYDRCFLDMDVDPLRYGLSSNRGVQTAWRLLPKPDLVVLLADTPDRVYARKPEIPKPEIQRQLSRWADLHERGSVQAVLTVDGDAAAMAQRLLPLIGDAFHRVNGSSVPDPAATR